MKKSKEKLKITAFGGVGHAPMMMEEDQISVVKNWLIRNRD